MDHLQLIEACSPEALYKFLHQVIDELCGRPQNLVQSDFVPDVWSDEVTFQKAVKTCKNFFQKSFTTDKKPLTELSDEKRKIVLECLEVRKGELKNGIIDRILESSSKAVVTDFDWQVKTVLSSDKLANIHETLVNLDIRTQESAASGTHRSRVISLEMNAAELDQLIAQLEEAQAQLAKRGHRAK